MSASVIRDTRAARPVGLCDEIKWNHFKEKYDDGFPHFSSKLKSRLVYYEIL